MDKKQSIIDLFVHDLTGPLSIASTSIQSLLSKQDKYGPITDRQKTTLKMVLRNVNKAQTFLSEMIEIYRSEEGLFRKDRCSVEHILRQSILEAIETINPNAAEKLPCEYTSEAFRQFLEENRVSVDITGKYSVSPFYHDGKKVQQIFRNLITNALKYRREKVVITISGDTDLAIKVEDDGSGISPDKQDCIFERFSHVKDKEGNGNEIKGLGFGLSCVKTIIEIMGGSITLSSREGAGTCFRVLIPPLQ